VIQTPRAVVKGGRGWPQQICDPSGEDRVARSRILDLVEFAGESPEVMDRARARSIDVTRVSEIYQCADTHRTARGLGIEAPMDRQPSVQALSKIAFIGLPCPK
jgi:hypothetical protein